MTTIMCVAIVTPVRKVKQTTKRIASYRSTENYDRNLRTMLFVQALTGLQIQPELNWLNLKLNIDIKKWCFPWQFILMSESVEPFNWIASSLYNPKR